MTYLTRLVKARSRLQAAILITGNLLVLADVLHVDAEVVAIGNAAVAAWLLVASSVLTGEGLDEITAEVDRRVASATAAVTAGLPGPPTAAEFARYEDNVAASYGHVEPPTVAPEWPDVVRGAPVINRRA